MTCLVAVSTILLAAVASGVPTSDGRAMLSVDALGAPKTMTPSHAGVAENHRLARGLMRSEAAKVIDTDMSADASATTTDDGNASDDVSRELIGDAATNHDQPRAVENETKMESFTSCKKDTGGTCWWSSCNPSRKSSCKKGSWFHKKRCMCSANTCAVNGKCVEVEQTQAAKPFLADTNSVLAKTLKANKVLTQAVSHLTLTRNAKKKAADDHTAAEAAIVSTKEANDKIVADLDVALKAAVTTATAAKKDAEDAKTAAEAALKASTDAGKAVQTAEQAKLAKDDAHKVSQAKKNEAANKEAAAELVRVAATEKAEKEKAEALAAAQLSKVKAAELLAAQKAKKAATAKASAELAEQTMAKLQKAAALKAEAELEAESEAAAFRAGEAKAAKELAAEELKAASDLAAQSSADAASALDASKAKAQAAIDAADVVASATASKSAAEAKAALDRKTAEVDKVIAESVLRKATLAEKDAIAEEAAKKAAEEAAKAEQEAAAAAWANFKKLASADYLCPKDCKRTQLAHGPHECCWWGTEKCAVCETR